jgi:hypothetical protein
MGGLTSSIRVTRITWLLLECEEDYTMAKTTHTITISRQDPEDPASPLVFEHSSTEGTNAAATSQGGIGTGEAFKVAPKDEVVWKGSGTIGRFSVTLFGTTYPDDPPFNGGVFVIGSKDGKATSKRVAKDLQKAREKEEFYWAVVAIDEGTVKYADPFMEIDDTGGQEG